MIKCDIFLIHGRKQNDEMLIRRRPLILDLESLKNRREELKKMNKDKKNLIIDRRYR